MKIAIEGCCHGQLDDIYGTLKLLELRENCKIDLVLICGDFQAIRNEADMGCMSVPPKYQVLGTFWKYYSGKAKAPYPTIFIGGNHEASNYLWELFHGGWVAENIYYMGNTGVINFNGVRIGGISGIFKMNDYRTGHYETSPYQYHQVKSVYHVREYDVLKVLQIEKPMDIFLSHDWPLGVEQFGNVDQLVREKPFFQQEIQTNTLGSPPNGEILAKLQPKWWFAAHLHVFFPAIVRHGQKNTPLKPTVENPDEIQIDFDDEDEGMDEKSASKVATSTDATAPQSADDEAALENTTKFLSLDKCLPRRRFLQVIDVETGDNQSGFTYDLEWLAITKAMHPYLSLRRQPESLPPPNVLKSAIESAKKDLEEKLHSGTLDLTIPNNFVQTAPAYDKSRGPLSREQMSILQQPFLNPQTEAFCNLIGIENKINPNRPTTYQPPANPGNAQTEVETEGYNGASVNDSQLILPGNTDEIIIPDEELEDTLHLPKKCKVDEDCTPQNNAANE